MQQGVNMMKKLIVAGLLISPIMVSSNEPRQVPTTAKKQKGESRSNNLMPPLHKQEKERYLRINSLEMTRFLMTTRNLVFSSD
jgi:hypothetical protein